jgi:hypothetical protein
MSLPMISTTGRDPRTTIVLLVLFGCISGWMAIPVKRTMALRIWVSSVGSECET